MTAGLYIHIPFCIRKCPYCDFYSIPYAQDIAAQYIDILSKEVEKINAKIDTVYIGGGTPTVLEPKLIEKLLKKLKPILAVSRENTIEANPESATKGKIKLFLQYGVNRISFGLQSFTDAKLSLLGRPHTSAEGIRAVKDARQCGFKNISVDLIFGAGNERLSDWKKELKSFLELKTEHISCYALTIEPGTAFFAERKVCDEAASASMYAFTMRFLARNGYIHYEVSNYAHKGYRCRHNLHYWRHEPYIGIGAGAVSFNGTTRTKNIADIKEYIRRSKKYISPVTHRERLSARKRAGEMLAVSIRTAEGVHLERFKAKSGFDFSEIVDRRTLSKLRAQGYVRVFGTNCHSRRIALTQKGFLCCDEVSSQFL